MPGTITDVVDDTTTLYTNQEKTTLRTIYLHVSHQSRPHVLELDSVEGLGQESAIFSPLLSLPYHILSLSYPIPATPPPPPYLCPIPSHLITITISYPVPSHPISSHPISPLVDFSR